MILHILFFSLKANLQSFIKPSTSLSGAFEKIESNNVSVR